MAIQTCSACRRLIEVDPPVCPACGATQPDSAKGARGRLLARLSALAACALLGTLAGAFLHRPSYEAQPRRFVNWRAARAASVRRQPSGRLEEIKRRLPKLRGDPAYPLTLLEDALADRAAYAGKKATVLLRVVNVLPKYAVVTGLGPLMTASVDTAAIPSGTLRGPKEGQHDWVAFRGEWRLGQLEGREPLHFAAESAAVFGPADADDLAQALGISD